MFLFLDLICNVIYVKSTCPLQYIDITDLKTGVGSPVGLVNSHNSERSHELQNLINIISINHYRHGNLLNMSIS